MLTDQGSVAHRQLKRAAGSAARNKGTNTSKTLGLPAAPPSSGSQGCRGCCLRTAKKKRGPTPSQFDALPLHRRSNPMIARGSPTGRRRYNQTTTGVSTPRKSRGPTLCSVRRIHPLSDDALLCSLRYNSPPSVEPLINKKTSGFPSPRGIHLMTRLAHAPPGRAT